MEYGINVWPWEETPNEIQQVVLKYPDGMTPNWVVLTPDFTPDGLKTLQESRKIFNADQYEYKTYLCYTIMVGFIKAVGSVPTQPLNEPQKGSNEPFTIDLPETAEEPPPTFTTSLIPDS